jgi:hypothetical protein
MQCNFRAIKALTETLNSWHGTASRNIYGAYSYKSLIFGRTVTPNRGHEFVGRGQPIWPRWNRNFYRHEGGEQSTRIPWRFMNNQNKNDDVAGTPEAGIRDPKKKQAQLDKHPRKGRNRVPNTEDELKDATENKTSQEKVRVEQLGEGYCGNTN